jgi:Cu/Ag efflux protein CusF
MNRFRDIFALTATVCLFSQPAVAQMDHSMKCHIQIELTEAAEKQLGGALYSGPELTPDEIMAEMKKAHQVHHPQKGGAFFMAPNKMNHLEVIYSMACGVRVYMYNAYTVPIRADRFSAFLEFVPQDDDQLEVVRILQPSEHGGYLVTGANHGVEAPFDIRLFMKFPGSDEVEMFSVKLDQATSQLSEGTGKVIEVDRAAGKLVIDHQAIPGYMGAMTMPYAVSNPDMLHNIEPGMAIKFLIDRKRNVIVKIDPTAG